MVEEAAQRDDDVLADDAGLEAAVKLHPGHRRHLPPRPARRPDARGVRAHDRRPECVGGAVQVRVRVAAHHQAARRDVALLDHHLVADPRAGRVEVDPVLARKRLDLGVLAEVLGRGVLNVVVDGKDRLARVMDLESAVAAHDRLELAHDRRRVVVGHDVLGADVDVVPGVGLPARFQPGRVSRGDFLDDGLMHGSPDPEYGGLEQE